jgi:hypothetical protein
MISAKDLENHIKTGKNYHNSTDLQGRPVISRKLNIVINLQLVYMRAGLDTPGDGYTKTKLMIYQMERSIRLMEAKGGDVEQLTWLVDLSGTNDE